MRNGERAFAAGKRFPAEAFIFCAEDAEAFSPPMTQSYKTHAHPYAHIDSPVDSRVSFGSSGEAVSYI